jgi:putative sigma-54 modulation protein
MEIILQSLHFTANPQLTEFVNEKVGSLSHLYNKIELATVTLKLEKSAENENKVCEIKLAVPGKDLFAKRQHQSFEEAINEVVDVLHEQIKTLKGKAEN